ncbi:MAG: hypothetical protein A2792_15280 [Sphingomonadales bacterium RIFCSPHIGHO2_01_FULL_65_20]|uniref:hypothetical protein n=1 Tax=Blastomonas sp. TaxID=1909299 RepID=UPI0008B563B1|nr:hypothetical protein [Blastomonas sp.]OHC97241.1 MAG: hypothetical protein A2792_15280 [Sphingomonadales bacterium RIFCSPHIGHO2_01_FULL_65_20]
MGYSDQEQQQLAPRSVSYIAILGLAAVALAAFLMFGFDAAADWIGLSKGSGFFLAGMLLLLNAILVVGLAIDLVIYCLLRLLRHSRYVNKL